MICGGNYLGEDLRGFPFYMKKPAWILLIFAVLSCGQPKSSVEIDKIFHPCEARIIDVASFEEIFSIQGEGFYLERIRLRFDSAYIPDSLVALEHIYGIRCGEWHSDNGNSISPDAKAMLFNCDVGKDLRKELNRVEEYVALEDVCYQCCYDGFGKVNFILLSPRDNVLYFISVNI